MERIYLEYKEVEVAGVGTGYGHLYLVKREQITDPNSIAQRNDGEIFRAGQDGVSRRTGFGTPSGMWREVR